MRVDIKKKLFRCGKKACQNQKSVFKKKHFFNFSIKINNLLLMSYLYSIKTPIQGIIYETGIQSGIVTS
jgi:hypothetical protein